MKAAELVVARLRWDSPSIILGARGRAGLASRLGTAKPRRGGSARDATGDKPSFVVERSPRLNIAA